MPDHDLSPEPDGSRPQHGGHYRADDDIELPPLPEAGAVDQQSADWPREKDNAGKPNRFSSMMGTAALIGAVLVGGWFLTRDGSAEQQHPNWDHVAAAGAASDANSNALIHVGSAGESEVLPAIEVSSTDRDRSTTQQIRSALRRNDLITATAALQAVQGLPTASQNPDVQPPQITADSELATALKDGRSELYQLELFDCCDEDGDIVEVLVNGASFATVPIMHSGTKLAIPLQRGNNTVSITGVKDGGGGVTVSFRTSRGDYFARSMGVGETHQMAVVVQ